MRAATVPVVWRSLYMPVSVGLAALFVAVILGLGQKELFLAGGLVLLLLFTLYKLELGVLALVVVSVLLPVGFFYSYPLPFFETPLFFPEVFLPILAAIVLIRPLLIKGRSLSFSRLMLPMALLVAAGAFSSYRAITDQHYRSIFDGYVGVYLILAPLLAYWVTLNVIRTKGWLLAVVGAVLFTAFAESVLVALSLTRWDALALFESKSPDLFATLPGGFLGSLLAIATIVASAWMLRGPGKPLHRAGLGFLVAVLLVAQLFLYARGSWLATAVGLATVVLLSARRRLLAFLVMAIIATGALLVVLAPGVAQPLLKAGYYSDEVQQRETLARLEEWRDAREIWAQDRLLGVGPGNYPYWATYVDYNTLKLITQAHSQYFQLLAEVGLIGLTLFLWAMAEAAREGVGLVRQARDPTSRTLSVSFLGSLAGMMVFGVVGGVLINDVEGGLYYFRGTVVFWVMLGLTAAYLRILRREATTSPGKAGRP